MRLITHRLTVSAAMALLAASLASCSQQPKSEAARGKYLVEVIGCGDCHTPGGFSPKPDATRTLAGSDSEFEVAGFGVFVPPNLTPDRATGLGDWTKDQIVKAVTTGVLPDGRILSPAMPWADFAHLDKADALAIAAYLQSLPAVQNKAPGPGAAKPLPAGVVESIVARLPAKT